MSSNKLLVGSLQKYKIDLPRLPTEIARCSLEYFISNEKTGTNHELAKVIGVNAHTVSKTEVEAIVAKIENE